MVDESFNGQYEVKKFLGAGSFAEVYLVRHNFLDDLRAMKIVKEPLTSNFPDTEIFCEVKIATRLRHENIISIYDAGVISKNNLAYFVMEYVAGGDLEQYLNSFTASNSSVPVNRVLDFARQILNGLNTLHKSKPSIVHRDLKLNNILLSYGADGEIILKISDFGIAKEVTTSISGADIEGTRPYMAPESFNGVVSTMADIYAVGVIFYQLLTNRFPYDFEEFDLEDILDLKPWKSPMKPPSYYNDNVSKQLDEIVMKCLNVNPNERYQDASELLEDVNAIIVDESDNPNQPLDFEYDDFVVNPQILKAFSLAKRENGLNEAIEILENEVLNDYDIRKYYSETLRIWKSDIPDMKLVSKAFTVNLRGKNYRLACDLLLEAIAYDPALKNRYQHYIDLWNIFIELGSESNLIKAVIALEELMDSDERINEIYSNVINTLKTYSVSEIVKEAIRLAGLNSLADASKLMEFAVVCDSRISDEYSYNLFLWKQNMKSDYNTGLNSDGTTIDYAIDLGTVDSLISYYNDGEPIIIKNHSTGEDFTPSAVLIDENNIVHVGHDAKNAILVDVNNAITEFKHNMGFSLPFRFEKTSRYLYPEELSAEVLKDLRFSVFKQCGADIEDAVICVPSNSNPLKTRAVNDAARLAGFKSFNLVLEPIAVGMAYDLKSFEGETWMIYDLGGGTFNASLIKSNGDDIELIATMGLDNLGGNVFDWRIVERLFIPKIIDDLHLDDLKRNNIKYADVYSKLKQAGEMAKIELSKLDEANIHINNLFDGYDFTYTLKRDEFRQIIRPLVKNTFDLCNELLENNHLSGSDIDKIVMVGGSCLNPLIKQFIGENFETSIEDRLNPLTVVSRGAAIYAGSLEKPPSKPVENIFSLIIGKTKGRLFSLDSTFLFLGFVAEVTKGGADSFKIPVNPDGTFKIEFDTDDYTVKIFNKNNEIRLDRVFKSKSCDLNHSKLNEEYKNLLNRLDNLTDFENGKIIRYAERLTRLSETDLDALNPAASCLAELEALINGHENDFRFFSLLENVENKIAIAEKNELFDVSYDLNEIVENRDFNALNDIYHQLIEKYVSLNKNDVMKACFFNLRFEGIYTENREYADELITKSLNAISNDDYDVLLECINRLYEIDERNGGFDDE